MTSSQQHPQQTGGGVHRRLCILCCSIFVFLVLELLLYLFFVFDLCFDSCHRPQWQIRLGYSLQTLLLVSFIAMLMWKKCFGLRIVAVVDGEDDRLQQEGSINAAVIEEDTNESPLISGGEDGLVYGED